MENVQNRVMRRRHEGETGFTLIELLVVIAVIAILGAIVIFNVTGVSKAGKAAACKTDVATLQTAVDAAVSDTGTGALPAGMTAGNFTTWLMQNGYTHSVPSATECATTPISLTSSTAQQGNNTVNVYTVQGQ